MSSCTSIYSDLSLTSIFCKHREVLWLARMDDAAEVKAVLKKYEAVLVDSWFPIRNSDRPPNNSAGGVFLARDV